MVKLKLSEVFVKKLSEISYILKRIFIGKPTYTIIWYFRNTAPLSEEIRSVKVPSNGRLTSVTLHFPDGCNSLVGFSIIYKENTIFPLSKAGANFIAFNNATITIPAGSTPIKAGDILMGKVENHDNTYPHTVVAIATISEV